MKYLKKTSENKIVIKSILLLAITVAIFYVIFSKVSFEKTIEILMSANKLDIIYSTIFLGVTLSLIILRWLFIIRHISKKITFADATNSFMSSLPLNSLLPSKLGDVLKAYYFRFQIRKFLGAIFSERFFDLLSLLLLSLLFSIILAKGDYIILSIITFFIFLLFFLLIKYLRRIKHLNRYILFKDISESIYSIIDNKRHFFIFLIISIVLWIVSFVQVYFLFKALHISIGFTVFCIGIIMVVFISLIPVTIAGMGTREAAMLVLFSGYADSAKLIAAGLLFSFFRYWLPSLLGLPFLIKSISKIKKSI
ncbi:MAG: lysylphosphatidylglycerol synthase transmembrane domain-containing protein [Candidatus Woesearchaeota archaeon]